MLNLYIPNKVDTYHEYKALRRNNNSCNSTSGINNIASAV